MRSVSRMFANLTVKLKSFFKDEPLELSKETRSRVLRLTPKPEFVQLASKKLDIGEEEVRRIWTELMKFLVVAASGKKGKYYVPSPIDALWHWFILCQEYWEEVSLEFGGLMPMHNPLITGDCRGAREEAISLGLEPDPELWVN